MSEITQAIYEQRRQNVFLILSSVFIASMAVLNIIGITKFIQLGPMSLAIGVLPYPLTFLCTDLISEFYGRKKANLLVMVGLFINLFILLILFVGQALPAAEHQPVWQNLHLAEPIVMPTGQKFTDNVELFDLIYLTTAGAMGASMLAYAAAQFCDVHLFHFWKRLTKGRHLWLRNNLSTLVSQLVDTLAVVSVTFGAMLLSGEMLFSSFIVIFVSNYLYKMLSALLDTFPLYFLVQKLSKYLNIDPKNVFD